MAMTNEKLELAVAELETRLVSRFECIHYDRERIADPMRFEVESIVVGYHPTDRLSNQDNALEHCLWMTREIRKMLTGLRDVSLDGQGLRDYRGRREKIMRWLGFVQGAMWFAGMGSIEAMKKMNMPDGAVPE